MFNMRDPHDPGEYDGARARANEAVDAARRVTMGDDRHRSSRGRSSRGAGLAGVAIVLVGLAILVATLAR